MTEDEDRKHREWLITSITEIKTNQRYVLEDIGEIKTAVDSVGNRVTSLEMSQTTTQERQRIWNAALSFSALCIVSSVGALWVWIRGGR